MSEHNTPTIENCIEWLDDRIDRWSQYVDKQCSVRIFQAIRSRLEENQIMRKLLWANHGCPQSAMYGDDGEMQCNACGFDFKRGGMKAFAEKRALENLKRYQEYLRKGDAGE